MANPRIDDLRKKLEKEPGSRLFAQLAEELRKDGDVAEAIRVARQGLAQHPNYPSARMTLGRALVDSGDLAAARGEFETVLNGAPDNILASRYLAECLEGLGEKALALHRYRATLSLAPGDKQVTARIQELEKGPSAPAAVPMAVSPGMSAAAPTAAAETAAVLPPADQEEDLPPIRLAEVDGPMELVTRFEPPAPPPAAPADDIFFEAPAAGPSPVVAPERAEAPVPLVPVEEEEFELERSYEAPPVVVRVADPWTPPRLPEVEADEPVLEVEPLEATRAEPHAAEVLVDAPAASPPVEPAAVTLEADVIDEEFDLQPVPPPGPPRVTFREDILEATGLGVEEGPREPAPPPPSPSPEPELASPTLAELYYEQGVPEKAAEVYRRLLERDPGNDRLRGRLREIEAAAGRAAPSAEPATPQEALGRAIVRLEELRSALARKD